MTWNPAAFARCACQKCCVRRAWGLLQAREMAHGEGQSSFAAELEEVEEVVRAPFVDLVTEGQVDGGRRVLVLGTGPRVKVGRLMLAVFGNVWDCVLERRFGA